MVRERFRFPRFSCTPVECYAVVADWDPSLGQLTAWSNFQGPFTLHGVAAAALGLRGNQLRLITPLGLGGLVRDQVVGLRVRRAARARRPQARRARPLDGGPDRAPHRKRRGDGSRDRRRGGLHGGRRADRAALRRGRGRRRLRAGAGAGDALPDARLALRRLPGAERRRAQPGRAHEHAALGAEPWVRRAAALLRARAHDGDRCAPPRPRPGRARAPQPRSGRGDAVPDPVRRALRLRRLRATASTTPSSSPAGTSAAQRRSRHGRRAVSSGSASRAWSSPRSRTWATSPSRRRPTSARRPLPKSGNAEGASVTIDPAGGIHVRVGTAPQGQGHRTVCAQVVADALGCDPADVEVLAAMDTASMPWTVASGSYSSRFSGVTVGAVQKAALQAPREGRCDPGAPRRRRPAAPPRRRRGALEPGVASRGDGAGARRRRATGRRRTSIHPTTTTASPPRPPTGSSSTCASSRSTGRPVPWRCSTTSPSTMPACSSTRCSPTARCSAASRTAPRVALHERHGWDEWGNPLTASFVDYLAPTAPDVPRIRIGHRATPSPFTRARREGDRRGEHDERAVRDRERGRRRDRT